MSPHSINFLFLDFCFYINNFPFSCFAFILSLPWPRFGAGLCNTLYGYRLRANARVVPDPFLRPSFVILQIELLLIKIARARVGVTAAA